MSDEIEKKKQDEMEARQIGDLPSGGYGMLGVSGLTRFGAVSRVYEEFLKELQGPSGMKNLREMSDNDPIIGSILYAANHLCRKVTYGFKPANDSNRAREISDFIGGAIFDDMETTWSDTLSEILTMLPFGWACMEFSMKRRMGLGHLDLTEHDRKLSDGGVGEPAPKRAPSRFEDGKIGFKSWSLRSQETLYMWEFDEDSKATYMQQMAPPDYRVRRIPMPKMLHFRTQVSKNNPEGRSILRNAWTSYYLKKNLQIFEGIGIERDLAGYPMIQIEPPNISKGQMPPDIWDASKPQNVQLLQQLQKIVRSVRVDEQAGLVMPWWAKFSLVNGGSRRRVDTNSIISRYDQRIAMSMMSDFIMLGHEAVGSKALAATKISLFTASLSSFLDVAGAIIDRQAVPILMRYNGFPMELAPTFYHGDVESVNLEDLGNFIKSVTDTGFNPLEGFDAQKAVMNAAKLPTDGLSGKMTLNQNNGQEQGGRKGKKKDKERTGDNKTGSPKAPVAPQESNTGSPDVLQET